MLSTLAAEEYRAVRGRSNEAKSIQQSIIQWSLGATAVVVGGALAGFRLLSWRGTGSDEFPTAVAVALCFVLPIILTTAFAIWTGETERVDRAAKFILKREQALRPERDDPAVGDDEAFGTWHLLWESHIQGQRSTNEYRNRGVGSEAVALMYPLLASGSLASGSAIGWTDTGFVGGRCGQLALIAWAGLMLLLLLAVSIRTLQTLQRARDGER